MGMLAPLYALAAIAIAGPILFHLIKRQPKGLTRFSSLMFLSPSPPRLTRRSRIDNILLLILRALAIGLIALAFTRPFFREESFLNRPLEGRTIALLIDTSASMQRSDIWKAAVDQAIQVVDSLSASDRIALYTVDYRLGTIVALDDASDPAARQETVRSSIRELKPSWRGSQLADGLKSIADQLQAASVTGQLEAGATSEVILVTDLHADCGIESIQGFPWPDSVRLDVRQIRPKSPGNARPTLLVAEDDSVSDDDSTIKIRIENSSDSTTQNFELVWMVDGKPGTSKTTVQVPAGQIRVVPVPPRPTGSNRLDLIGDAWDADNAIYFADQATAQERILYCGPQTAKPEEDPAYFLEKAPLSTPMMQRVVERVDATQLGEQISRIALQVDPKNTSQNPVRTIVVETSVINSELVTGLRGFVLSGGTLIVCVGEGSMEQSTRLADLRTLLGEPTLTVSEANVKDYALLSHIDYQSPIFRPFADPRFNDFSKIRFWNYRRVEFSPPTDSQAVAGLSALASLDDGSPWLLQAATEHGHMWLITGGWQPTSSQMGLSTKFVPILLGLLDPSGKSLNEQRSFVVGEPILVSNHDKDWKLTTQSGETIATSGDQTTIQVEQPGLYQFQSPSDRRQIVVQIADNESRLNPLDVDVFEQYQIPLGKVQTDSQRKQTARQLQATELERKQRVWQWLLLAGLLVLAIESGLAGFLAGRSQLDRQPTPQTS